MKRFITLLLILSMMASFSATAFAAGGNASPSTQPSAESDVFEPISAPADAVDLSDIELPKDVSVEDDTGSDGTGSDGTGSVDSSDIVLDKLAMGSDAIEEEAKEQISALERSGYQFYCAFTVWSKSGDTEACTIKLSEDDVKDGQIFVNGKVVEAELKDGYYIFTVTLPAVIVVAHK